MNEAISSPILVVEDNGFSLSLIRANLQKYWDVEIHPASGFAQARELLKKHRFEYLVAICDLNLPDAPNGEILDLVDKAGVRFIALTGAFDRQTRKTLSKQHFVDYILKDSKNSYDYVARLVGRLYKNQFKQVLIVEDSPTASILLQEILELLNFQVLSAENGVEALSLLEQHPNIRLVITDYEMPKMDGFEFTVKVRENLDKNQLAIIGLSASERTDLGAMFLKKGANDFLLKPYSFEELLCRINMNMDTLEHLDYIEDVSNRDSLTGLFNRRHFQSSIDAELKTYINRDTRFMVALLDIDELKNINKQYGPDCGDAVVIHFSNLLASTFKDQLVARFSAEKFVILFKGITTNKARKLLEQFRAEVSDSTIEFSGNIFNFTVSIGLSSPEQKSADLMLSNADENLYQAKRSGKNKVISAE